MSRARSEGLLLVRRVVVGDAGEPRVHVGAAQLLGRHLLAGRRLHEGRPPEEDRALPLDDHRLVAHRRHVGPARGARAEDDAHLREAESAHPRLVVEDPAEVVAVGEDLRLEGQEGPARVHQVEAGQAVLEGDLLGPQVLLDRDREVGAALHGRVVGHDHDLAAPHAPDPADEAGGRGLALVHPEPGQGPDLEEGCPGVEEPLDPLADGELALLAVAAHGLLAATGARREKPRAQLVHEAVHARLVLGELRGGDVDPGLEDAHSPASPRQMPSSRAVRIGVAVERHDLHPLAWPPRAARSGPSAGRGRP